MLILKPPGATTRVDPVSGQSGSTANLNQTFTATQGDFCTEGPFPADPAKTNAGIGVLFWGTDYSNYWGATAYADGAVWLSKLANNQWSTIFSTPPNSNLVKTGPTDVNSVRAVVKNGTITIIVNGKTVRSVRAQMPGGDLKFGFKRSFMNASSQPVVFTVGPYKVTALE